MSTEPTQELFELWCPALYGWTIVGPYDHRTVYEKHRMIPGSRVKPASERVLSKDDNSLAETAPGP